MDLLLFLGSMNGESSRQELARCSLATHTVTARSRGSIAAYVFASARSAASSLLALNVNGGITVASRQLGVVYTPSID
jgi:hypothetical protein